MEINKENAVNRATSKAMKMFEQFTTVTDPEDFELTLRIHYLKLAEAIEDGSYFDNGFTGTVELAEKIMKNGDIKNFNRIAVPTFIGAGDVNIFTSYEPVMRAHVFG